MSRKRRPGSDAVGVDYDAVTELARALPGVEETTSYGTPALVVGKRMLARLKEDGTTLVLRSDMVERDHLLRAAPDVFFVTDHYRNYPYVLIRLERIGSSELDELLRDAWRRIAPKRAVARFDAEQAHDDHG